MRQTGHKPGHSEGVPLLPSGSGVPRLTPASVKLAVKACCRMCSCQVGREDAGSNPARGCLHNQRGASARLQRSGAARGVRPHFYQLDPRDAGGKGDLGNIGELGVALALNRLLRMVTNPRAGNAFTGTF